ncbi:glucosyltransferase [Polyrhizophydium stewartii]|uniref:Dol-P-Glc:Glc(2)Man(9)GlcNAc(2)-PP-Dol alpha-1,2-glucosyltransferase n=1 Tax=Polyrhizophydium stewartii TaxID=2732419 RepID=A0ABR4NAI4_9FUNG|nr:glucosyltransferase [Polyrhizophydium stewartii]
MARPSKSSDTARQQPQAPDAAGRTGRPTRATAAAAAALSIVLAALTAVVSTSVPEPYMDEIFHVPMAQKYCQGRFDEWDPKITTPPGLYLVAAALLSSLRSAGHAAGLALGADSAVLATLEAAGACSTANLRAINAGFGIGTLVLMDCLLSKLHPGARRSTTAFAALAISLMPVAFFFHSLFYTDSGSTFFVLWAYLLSLQDRFLMSGIAAFVSVWFRQTNIIWTVFIAATVAFRKVGSSKSDAGTTAHCLGTELRGVIHLVQIVSAFVLHALWHLPRLLLVLWPYVLCVGAFVGFVAVNGSIVLGDKDNHMAGIHVPQLYYFAGFSAFFALFPAQVLQSLLAAPGALFRSLGHPESAAIMLAAPAVMLETIRRFTIEHPFLLADNRHFTFYIWKNVFRRHPAARYALVPGYLFAGWALLRRLGAKQHVLWIAAFVGATALVLVPSPLLEFRYFIVPYMLLRLHVGLAGGAAAVLELAQAAAINAAAVWLFVARPFEWPSEPGAAQRFMW